MPVDPTGWCCGLMVWIGGTLWVFVATARQARATPPGEIPPPWLPLAGPIAMFILFFVAVAIGLAYDLLGTRRP